MKHFIGLTLWKSVWETEKMLVSSCLFHNVSKQTMTYAFTYALSNLLPVNAFNLNWYEILTLWLTFKSKCGVSCGLFLYRSTPI